MLMKQIIKVSLSIMIEYVSQCSLMAKWQVSMRDMLMTHVVHTYEGYHKMHKRRVDWSLTQKLQERSTYT